jgi:hypothetical protein
MAHGNNKICLNGSWKNGGFMFSGTCFFPGYTYTYILVIIF